MENEEKLAGGNGQIRNVFSGWYAGDYNFYLPFKGEESAYLAIPSSIVSVSLVSVKRLGHLDSIPVDVTREEILSVAERYKSDIIARGAGSYRKKSLDF